MINILLPFLAVASFSFSTAFMQLFQQPIVDRSSELTNAIPPIYPQVDVAKIRAMLKNEAPTMNEALINKAATALKCTITYHIANNNILTVIDYSLPSNQKRLWIFDLSQKKLLFHTYVSHGIKSGTLLTDNFSNKYNSKASSIGVYKTDKAYYGREGLSLRLEGLERHFNDNAMNRAIVMHGGWYMDEAFIKKYGRPGRSWGCPALPLSLYQPIIKTIKDNSLLVVYYPSDEWFGKSKFLTCDKVNKVAMAQHSAPLKAPDSEHRDEVFFAQVNKGAEDKPILVMPAHQYQQVFHAPAPLGRMLRRQIEKEEYIALNNTELNEIIRHNEYLNGLYFVVPRLKMVRGYYETEMKIVNLGSIRSITPSSKNLGKERSYTVSFNANNSVRLQSTDRFIRWLGL